MPSSDATTDRSAPTVHRRRITADPHVLGIDIGSTNVKVVLVRVAGTATGASATAGSVSAGTATGGTATRAAATGGTRACDRADAGTVTEVVVRAAPTPPGADALIRTVHDLVRAALAGRPAPRAVGVASMAETGAALDARGEPLTDLLRWDAGRGGDDASRIAERLGRSELFAATGVRVSAKVPLVTWAWLRRTEPDLWRRVARWAGAADLVAHALTGRLVTDHTLAGRTMAYRLPAAGVPVPEVFDDHLLREVGLRADQLPRVARPGEAAGVVVDPRFVAAGIPAGTPVVVAGHDHAVGTWAAGVRAPGQRGDSLGTAEAVLTVVDPSARRSTGTSIDRAAVATHGMSLVRTAAGEHEALLAGSPAAGGMVAWWLATVLPGRTADDAFPAEPPRSPTGLVVLPYPQGRQSPAPDPAARVRVLDADGADLSGELLVALPGADVPVAVRRVGAAVLEGLAHQARWMLDVQRRLAGHAVDDAASPLTVLAGAAGANAAWMGLKAAVADGPVRVVTALEPVATGAALLAADRLGLVPAGSVRLATRRVARPPGPREAWSQATARFVSLATG